MYPAGVMEPTLESRSWKLPPPVAKVTLFLFTVNTGKVFMMIMMVVTIKTGPEKNERLVGFFSNTLLIIIKLVQFRAMVRQSETMMVGFILDCYGEFRC